MDGNMSCSANHILVFFDVYTSENERSYYLFCSSFFSAFFKVAFDVPPFFHNMNQWLFAIGKTNSWYHNSRLLLGKITCLYHISSWELTNFEPYSWFHFLSASCNLHDIDRFWQFLPLLFLSPSWFTIHDPNESIVIVKYYTDYYAYKQKPRRKWNEQTKKQRQCQRPNQRQTATSKIMMT